MSFWVRAALHCDTSVVSRALGAFSPDFLPWLNALVCSHFIFLLHPWVCQGIYSVFVWTCAYSQESEASDLAQADRRVTGLRPDAWEWLYSKSSARPCLNSPRARAVGWLVWKKAVVCTYLVWMAVVLWPSPSPEFSDPLSNFRAGGWTLVTIISHEWFGDG